MLLIVLVVITLTLTFFEIKTRNMPLGAIAAGMWIVAWQYLQANYSAYLSTSALNIIAIVFIVTALIFFFWGIIANGKDDTKKVNRWGREVKEPPAVNETRRRYGTDRLDQSPEEYKEMVHRKLHPHEKD